MRQHIMKQPNLQELRCPNTKKSRVAMSHLLWLPSMWPTLQQFYTILKSHLRKNAKKLVSLILCMPSSSLGRSFSTRFHNEWQQVKSAQFVAVGPSMCWRSHGLHWLLLGLHPLVPQTTHQSKWSDENKLVRLKIRRILGYDGYWMFYSMFQHSNFSFHPFSATPARSSPRKGARVSRPVVGPWVREQAAI